MYPVLPFGPVTIPTGPLVGLVALTLGLEVAGRFGRRLHLSLDDVWNTGLLSILVGLIMARLWNVLQFWAVYWAEPWLLLSLRPSGFVWSTGVTAGVITAYSYLWRRALPLLPMVVAGAAGALTALALLAAGAFLTGSIIGLPSTQPWALPYFGVLRHPVALYYAAGFVLLVVGGWFAWPWLSSGRLLWGWLLGSGLLLLWLGAYEEGSRTIASFRANQLLGLLLALSATLGLAQRPRNTPGHAAATPAEQGVVAPPTPTSTAPVAPHES